MYCLQHFFLFFFSILIKSFIICWSIFVNIVLLFSISFNFLSLWTLSKVPLNEWRNCLCLQWTLQMIQYLNHLLLNCHYLPIIPCCPLYISFFCFSKFMSFSVLLSKKAFTPENYKYYVYYEGHVSNKNQGISILKEAIKTSKWNWATCLTILLLPLGFPVILGRKYRSSM